MDLIFVLLTQLVNHTSFELGFEVDGDRRLLPKLPKGKTRYARQSRILRRFRKSDPGWKIRVMIEGEFSGIELDPEVLLNFVRVVFSIEEKEEGGSKWKVLCVHGVLENHTTDFLLRHRYFGWMRDRYWSSRKLEFIDRSDSSLAAKSRSLDGGCRYLAPFVNVTVTPMHRRNSSTYASPQKRSPSKNNITTPSDHIHNRLEDEIPKDNPQPVSPREVSGRPSGTATPHGSRSSDDELPSAYVVEGSFVHVVILVFSFVVFVCVKFMIF